MSRTKKSAAEIAEQIERTQKRIDALKKKEREATKTEAAKERVELVKAVHAWADTMPRFSNGYSNTELINYFHEWAEMNRKKAEQVQGGSPVGPNG